MNKQKLNAILHLVSQIIAQGAIVEVVPEQYRAIFSAIAAVIGVLVAYSDGTIGQMGGWK